MTGQLTKLLLSCCTELPLTELRHVHALKGLKSLDLSESFNESMDSHSQSLFTPPSALMPQLDKFEYTPPLAADQNDHEDEDEAEEVEDDADDNESQADE
jgi:hypothetical protein